MTGIRQNWKEARGFLTRLARDTRGNTLALMAIAIIPLAGIIGGGIDISRMYIVKTRLQHACDAGALAGRKAMGAGLWSQTGAIDGSQETNYPQKIAMRYFDGNFDRTAYGGTTPAPEFTEAGGKVSGKASVSLPMTLMKIFGRTAETLSVTCEADMRLPNTDVMFVLDNTGSMGDTPSGDTQTKLQSLKDAVKCFYEIVARLDTTEVCTTGNPSGGVGGETQVRFGFVLYDTNVNVGKLLPTAYLADDWAFRSREIESIAYPTQGTPTETSSSIAWGSTGNWQDKAYSKSGTSATNCSNNVPATATNATGAVTRTQLTSSESPGSRTVTYKEVGPVTQSEYRYDSYSGGKNGTCYYDKRDTPGTKTAYFTRTDTAQVTWHYGLISQNIAGLKNGTDAWNDSIQVRIGNNGTMKTVGWDGCISERHTDQDIDFTAAKLPATAMDLDIDTVPSSGDANSLWGPVMKDMIYTPKGSKNSWDKDDQHTTSNYSNSSSYSCLAESRKLQEWKDASIFEGYVDSMRKGSNTYHDIGLIWGARLMSPTGIFKAENATTPKGGEIQRHMIFMTDGDPCTAAENYTAYGVAWFDHLQTTADQPADGATRCTEGAAITDQVNARTQAICKEIKKKDITLWVITFGYVDPRTVTRMTTCASDGRYFSANNKVELQDTFKKIADQISALRLTN
ncbi:hypothetical protein FHS95_000191 [Sphingomonas naasensis]|uniref:VWA domain-containing protein n=1 Tax=Sphingomonas naasensis TaxID=1344951 RepID=A0A4S1WSW0_9SPHN|nr:vWA domain-containing protein [Sphingomonas naasensis]NIJ18522.1 hypothetical protein [Sphingomonas naasensis]TGX45775.1 VWA domain-containing protein [Sphingomonas naasensis]